MPETQTTPDIAALTVQLLSAYLSNNTVAAEDLAGLIRSTRTALVEDNAPAAVEPEAPTFTPAVSARKSLSSPDHILSLIDGKPYKTLKRHLASNGLTPEQYRERYNLPASYPMVAPTFAARRREIAEQIGLGNSRKPVSVAKSDEDAVLPEGVPSSPVEAKPTPKRKPSKPAVKKDAENDSGSAAPATGGAAKEPRKASADKPTAKSRGTKSTATRTAKAKEASDAPKSAVSEPYADEAPAAPADKTKPVTKRRGKLGLFQEKRPAAEGEVAEGATTSRPGDASARKEAKAPRAKRMARAPKDTAPTKGRTVSPE
jgi:predicted transcriptional regulator